jgi:hypothetical protein
MSRQNKVNPGMYTQRGRLTQDDAARELKRQREVGSEHTWQPSKRDHFPRLASNNNGAALRAETSGDNESEKAAEAQAARPAKPKQTARHKSKTVNTSKAAKKTAIKAKTGKSAKTAKPSRKRAATTVRKAVLARNVGGGGPKPRKPATRRKS